MGSSASESAGANERRALQEDFPHLSDLEWAATERLATSIGGPAVGAMLIKLSEREHLATIAQFIQSELNAQVELLRQQQSAAAVASRTRRPDPLKIDILKYKAHEGESLARWLVERDDAIGARRFEDDGQRVVFATSNFAGRAKVWALGLKLRDPNYFGSLAKFKRKLCEAFEPPKIEFKARTEFLDLRQGKRDIHAYAQQARYLVSCAVTNLIDEQTQVVCYIKDLVDGPIKTYLLREYSNTLEQAISLSMQEDFSHQQAYVHSAAYRPPKHDVGGSEPMNLSNAKTAKPRACANKSKVQCHRCGKLGHYAYECNAPYAKGASRGGRSAKMQSLSSACAAKKQQHERGPKNGQGQ